MQFYYTYVLKSEKDFKHYIGYSKNRRPLKLIYYEACLNKEDALHREKYLKTHYGRMFLKNRLKSYLTG